MTKKSFLKDESGQAGVIVVLIIALVVFSLVYIFMSVIVDEVISFHNEISDDYHTSAERKSAVDLFMKFWYALPVIVLFTLFFWAIKEAIRARSGEVR